MHDDHDPPATLYKAESVVSGSSAASISTLGPKPDKRRNDAVVNSAPTRFLLISLTYTSMFTRNVCSALYISSGS